jgi:hypothetical protein
MPLKGKPARIVIGAILLIDGICLAGFAAGADLLGTGQGYGLGRIQLLGILAATLVAGFGLGILLLSARSSRP